jgi:branched-chain amino acid aminotransferase
MIEGFIAQQTTANLRIRSTFFRALGGRYTPQKQTFEYYFEASPLQSATYSNHESSITIGIAQQVRLSVDALSNLKTTSALPYVLAGIEKQEKGWDDCLLLNHRGYLAEAVAANVFLKQGKRVLTPALDQGCVAGIMRQQLLHLLPQLGYQVKETTVDLAQLQEAEEVWLTNALQGVVGIHQWLGRHKPYKQVAVREVQEYLNLWIKKSEL